MANNENFKVIIDGTEVSLNKTDLLNENLSTLPNNGISLINGNKSYTSRIVNIDRLTRTVTLELEGKTYKAQIENELDLLLKNMGFSNAPARVLKEIKAPMPGMVLEVNVAAGDMVEAGMKLLVLEAMKMENIISLPADCKIGKVMVKKGEAVQKNQVLLELDNG